MTVDSDGLSAVVDGAGAGTASLRKPSVLAKGASPSAGGDGGDPKMLLSSSGLRLGEESPPDLSSLLDLGACDGEVLLLLSLPSLEEGAGDDGVVPFDGGGDVAASPVSEDFGAGDESLVVDGDGAVDALEGGVGDGGGVVEFPEEEEEPEEVFVEEEDGGGVVVVEEEGGDGDDDGEEEEDEPEEELLDPPSPFPEAVELVLDWLEVGGVAEFELVGGEAESFAESVVAERVRKRKRARKRKRDGSVGAIVRLENWRKVS